LALAHFHHFLGRHQDIAETLFHPGTGNTLAQRLRD